MNDRYSDEPNPFLDRMLRDLDKLNRSVVRHGETCPHCGRTLVNLYLVSEGVWACRRCKLRLENTHYGKLPITTTMTIDGIPTSVEITEVEKRDG